MKFTLCNNNNNKGTEFHDDVNWNIWYPKYISERTSCTFIAKCLSQDTCIVSLDKIDNNNINL